MKDQGSFSRLVGVTFFISISLSGTRKRPGPDGSSWCRGTPREAGFTLIELLAVLAILGILAAVVFPVTSSVRISADRARTRMQFQQWVAALESFRQEYGGYPLLPASGKVNAGATVDGTGLHPFHDILAGRRRDGSALPEAVSGSPAETPEVQNPRRVPFLLFPVSQLGSDDDPDPMLRNRLRDPFGNTDIAVVLDRNLDGVIDGDDVAEWPEVSPPGAPGVRLRPPSIALPARGIVAGAVFYCAPPDARTADSLILSWQ